MREFRVLWGVAAVCALLAAARADLPTGFEAVDAATASRIVGGQASRPCNRSAKDDSPDTCCAGHMVPRDDVDGGTGGSMKSNGSILCATVGGGGCTFKQVKGCN